MAGLAGLSMSELEAEIKRRQKRLPRLERLRRRLQDKLQNVEREIAMLGGEVTAGARGRLRPRNKQPLADVIVKVLEKNKGPMKVSNIVESVKDAGYRTTSANFSTIVNQTLLKDKRFKSTQRGYYGLTG